jgi:LuxR family transcriptional regulator, quorum-sensing system regulator BjaR1
LPVLGQVDSFWGARALEFVDAVERARSPADVMKLFNQSIAEAGFNAYVMVGLPDNVTTFPKRLMANGWPDEWADLYIKENLCDVDPVALHCMRTVDPFDWNTAPLDPARERKALSVMQRASDFRMKHGFCVPIHYGDGSGGAAVSIAGDQPDLAKGVRSAMLLMSLYAHHRVRGLLTPPRPRKPLLTAREREVLTWCAAGKSSWEIGRILNISQHTADAHFKSAVKKLKAPNRLAAVVLALRTGEISQL